MEKLNVGVVGCGNVTARHFKAWKKHSSAKLVAVADINEALAKATAKTWGIQHSYSSVLQMLESEHLDIIDICTPAQTHKSVAIMAMKAGVNVLIEKPLALTLEDGKEIVNVHKATHVSAGVIHNWLFEKPVLQADKLLENGKIGKISHVNVSILARKDDSMTAASNHWTHRLQGGRFIETLAHPIYLLQHFLGPIELRNVSVSKVGPLPWMIYDEFCATFSSNKRFGSVYMTFNAPRESIGIDVIGEEGMVKIDTIDEQIIYFPPAFTSWTSRAKDYFRQVGWLTKSYLETDFKVATGRWVDGHEACMNKYIDSLLAGREPPVTVEDDLAVSSLIDQVSNIIAEPTLAKR